MHINVSCGGTDVVTVHPQGGSTKSDEPFIPRGRWKVNGLLRSCTAAVIPSLAIPSRER